MLFDPLTVSVLQKLILSVFLGAGIIFFDQSQSRVQGLITAAGVWVAAAIGMVIGFGLLELAVWATLLTILVFLVLWPVERRFVKRFAREDRQGLD